MKNSIKFLVAVIAVLAVYSCNKPGHSSASYNLGVTFEVNISENPQMKDSIVTAPHYSWDQVIYFNSQASDVNVGYTGGFALSAKKGSEVVLDNPLQTELAGRAFRFYKANRERLYDTVPTSRTHLLYSTDTFYGWSYNACGFKSFVDACEKLNRESVPYVIAAERDVAALKPGDLLVMPDARFLSRRLYERIEAAGRCGVKVLALGLAGQYNENGRERAKDDPIVGLKCVANIVPEIPSEFKVETSVCGVMTETQVNRRGELVLHLLRPGNAETVGELRVVLGCKHTTDNAEVFSFEDGCAFGNVAHDDAGHAILTVRNFRTMCSIVLAGGSKL